MNHTNKTVAFHRHYRAQRALGKSKVESLETAKRVHSADYHAYCREQEAGNIMQGLDEPDTKRVMSILSNGGKLP